MLQLKLEMCNSTAILIFTLIVSLELFNGVQSNVCVCTNATNYAPVCANDGRTYSNSKLVYCYNVCLGKNLKIVANRACTRSPQIVNPTTQIVNPTTQMVNPTTQIVNPTTQSNCNNCWALSGTITVCGTDGIKYPSLESMKCFSGCRNQNLQVLVTGECPTNICFCSNLGGNFPVCGNDGRSYRNSEVLTCLNKCQGTYTQIASMSACPAHNWLNQQSLHFPTK